MEKPRNKFKKWPIIAIAGLILLFLSFVVPLPYYIMLRCSRGPIIARGQQRR